VWVGNDDNTPMKEVVGGDLPAKIWHDFVAAAELNKANRTAPATGNGSVATGSATPTATGNTATAIEGVPVVVDTATLSFQDRLVHLFGVSGERGRPASDMASYIGGREVTCRPSDVSASEYRCRVGEYDLAEAVLFNGGGRATPDAPAELKSAEEKARSAGRGVWAR
jgi:penicillin-binding protein 1A